MAEPIKLTRIPALKTVAEFRAHVASLGIDLPCEDAIATGSTSPLAQPLTGVSINGKRIGNRYAIHPMEGWDGTTSGGLTDDVLRRWRRFGESGAKLIFGGEAMAVRPDGRANPNQLIIIEQNKADLAKLRETLVTGAPATPWHDRRPGHRVSTDALRAVLQTERQVPLGAARGLPASHPRPDLQGYQRRAGLDR